MKITREAIAAALTENQSLGFYRLFDRADLGTYYLHVTDEQELVPFIGYGQTGETFHADRDVSEFFDAENNEHDVDAIYETETLDNPDFAAVVDDLYRQVAEYFGE